MISKKKFIVVAFLLRLIDAMAVAGFPITLPHCLHKCGNVGIPYPFGMSEGCYLNEYFIIYCNSTHFDPPRPFLKDTNVEVLEIFLDGRLRVLTHVAVECNEKDGVPEPGTKFHYSISKVFPLSFTLNKFVAIGCDTFAVIHGENQKVETGCMSVCKSFYSLKNKTCNGLGCCQTSIPKNLFNYNVNVSSLDQNRSLVENFSPCSYSFLVEESSFNFNTMNLTNISNQTRIPTVLDWAVGNQACEEAKKYPTSYACKRNTSCSDPDNGPGYRCRCKDGYEGNPYLQNGCKGKVNQRGRVIKGATGGGAGLLALLVGFGLSYCARRSRKLMKLKKKYYDENGGPMLVATLAEWEEQDGTDDAPNTIYSIDDISKATDSFDKRKMIRRGGYGNVYKGKLPGNNKTVAVKKSKIVDREQIEQFINEVAALSHIKHSNLVELLGCCLDTEVPLLIYDHVTDETLHNYIHDEMKASIFSWELRLKVAAEIADVLAYMHSEGIIHRDVKSQNIVLDDNFTPKMSDFGASSLVPMDQDQISTVVQGTVGYLDPEYILTSQLTEKSDVYSFGVVLVELLTGKDAAPNNRRHPKDKTLVLYFLSALEENRLSEVIADCIEKEEVHKVQLVKFAKLVKRCLSVKAEERPTMREVAMELEELRKMGNNPLTNDDSTDEVIDTPPVNADDLDDNGEISEI